MELLRPLPDRPVQGGLDGVLLGQGVHPGGEEQVQLLQGEFIQHLLEQAADVLLPQLQAVGRHTGHLVPLGDVRPDGPGTLRVRIGGVEHHQEGLS